MSSMPDSPARKHRLRIRQACQSCRQRKRRCDGRRGRRPCEQCETYSYECSFIEEGLNYKPGHSPSETLGTENPSTFMTVGQHGATSNPTSSKLAQDVGQSDINQAQSAAYPGTNSPFGIVNLQKGRFVQFHSSINLARNLAIRAGLPKIPRLHAYAYNVGIRREHVAEDGPSFRGFLSLATAKSYIHEFFQTAGQLYQITKESTMMAKCEEYWSQNATYSTSREVYIAGMVALGSFFSISALDIEGQLVEHARNILDAGSGLAPGRISVEYAAGWILRTLYLRCTTRPHLAWFASCATLHVTEALGLHVDLNVLERTEPPSEKQVERSEECENIYTIALFLNALISAEYGRSRVILQGARELKVAENAGVDPSRTLHNLTYVLLSADNSVSSSAISDKILETICALPTEPPVLALLKADVALYLYRRLVNGLGKSGQSLTQFQHTSLLLLIQSALVAGHCIIDEGQAWYNLLSTPFQAFITLADIGSDESLTLLQEVIALMSHVKNQFNTHSAQEALDVVKYLLDGLATQKKKQAEALWQASSKTTTYTSTITGARSEFHVSANELPPHHSGLDKESTPNFLEQNPNLLQWLDVYGLNASSYVLDDPNMFLFDELPYT